MLYTVENKHAVSHINYKKDQACDESLNTM